MTRRKACALPTCSTPRGDYRGNLAVFCVQHLRQIERNRRRYVRRPGRAADLDLRVHRGNLLSAIPDTPGISSSDWGAFTAAVRDYREAALDGAFTPAARQILDSLDPLARRRLRERCAQTAGETDYGRVLDLDLVSDGDGWRVEAREPLTWMTMKGNA